MTQRDRIVVGVVAAIALLAGYWFLLLAPKREEAAKVATQVTEQELRRDEAQSRIVAGEAARRGYAENYATIARLGKAVPLDDQVPSLIYQIESAADRASIDFRSLRLSQATGGATAAPAPQASQDGSAPATQSAAAVAPPGSSIGAAGFPTMPFGFAFDGDFFRMERFLSEIERFTQTSGDADVRVRGRLLTVDGISLTASRDGFPKVKASVAATAYLLPPDEATAAGTAPADGTGATTPTANTSGATP